MQVKVDNGKLIAHAQQILRCPGIYIGGKYRIVTKYRDIAQPYL